MLIPWAAPESTTGDRLRSDTGLNLTVVNEVVDPTFSFMTVDWDGQIRMDPSSVYAMQRLIAMKDRFDLSFACDTDHDRHGIVTKSAGLLPPNHYLSVAIFYLFQHRPKWRKEAAVGKTVVSSQMIDRVTAKLGRKLYEVPVGFKWFVDGLLDGSLGFGGEESAGASFSRLDGTVWTTDKDGIVPALLAAEITARMGRDPGEIYQELTSEFGEPVYDRVEAPATPDQKELLAKLSPQQVKLTDLAGEKIQTVLTDAPGNGAPIGGLKVVAESGWFAARPSGTENIYKIYAESFQGADHLSPHSGGSPDDCQRRIIGDAGASSGKRTKGTVGVTRRTLANAFEDSVRNKFGAGTMSKNRHASATRSTAFFRRKSTDSIPWQSLPSTCAGRGTMPRTECGALLIPSCGNSRKILGWFCRRSRGTNSTACWPTPRFRKNIDDLLQSQASGRGDARMVSAKASAISFNLRRVFQHGIHVERSAPDLFGRTRQCGRRSTQSRQRFGRASGRSGTALPTRLFSPGD